MNYIIRHVGVLVLALMSTAVWGQTVSGTVTDENNQPLPGATVVVQGTNRGTSTDFDGKYQINASQGETLVFSYVGYATQSIAVSGATQNVSLQPDNALEEVIVTGQGSGIQRRKLSTTVDVLLEKDIELLPGNQIDQLLQSTAPSAHIRLSSGQPGTASIIRTRGPISASSSTTPVIIVDGIRVDNLNSNPDRGIGTGGADVSALADIPVESIEKIEYIKGGAATTLYGADAANGVIQIITKKGQVGRTNSYFETRSGFIRATRDFLKYKRTGEALFEPGVSQEYKIGFNGGSEKFTYNFAGSLYNDDSYNDINRQLRRSFSFGFGADFSKRLKYQGSMSFVNYESNLDYNANTSWSRFSGFEGAGRGNLDEIDDAKWETEKNRSKNVGEAVDIAFVTNRFTASNKFIYDAAKNFKINFTFGTDYRTNNQQENITNKLQVALGSKPEGTTDQAELTRVIRNSFIATADLNLTHRASLNDNFEFVTILGGQFFRNTDRQTRVEGTGGVDGTKSLSYFPTISSSDFILENANYGLYFLENIGFYDIAFLEFGGRLDYNTSAGDNTDALFLPKIGATYNFSDHKFYKDSNISNIINFIKVRANYGVATNFAQPFKQDRTFALESFLGAPAFRFDNPGNKNLISEKVHTTEYGVELGFLDNRINIGVTKYDAVTKDALFTPTQPPSSGLLNQVQNIGEIENSGWEFSLSSYIIRNDKHNLRFSASYNTNENLVSDSGGAPPFNVGGFTVIGSWVEEGKSLGYLRGTAAFKKSDGTYETVRNSNLGKSFAPRFGSFSLSYNWNKFNFFTSGDYQLDGTIVDLSFLLRHLRGHDSTGIPKELDGKTSPFNYTNFFAFESDFVKIRTIGVSYDFGPKLNFIENIKLGFTATNPFNWTKGKFDPETTGSGIGNQNSFGSGGFVYGTESAPRTYITSLKIEF